MLLRIWTQRRDKTEPNHELIWGSIATLALLAAIVLPMLPTLGYRCPFLKFTGRPCFSCGMARSFVCAIRGQFLTALRWNPVGLMLFLLTAFYVPYSWTVVLFRLPAVRIRLTSRLERVLLNVLLLAIVIANWIYVWNNNRPY